MEKTWKQMDERYFKSLKHSGKYMHHLLNIKSQCILSTDSIYIFTSISAWFSSLKSINQLVFVMKVYCVSWEVRTEFLNITLIKVLSQNCL
jgi:hypothetical protein